MTTINKAGRKIERSEILDHETYAERRDVTRAMVMEVKRRRRVHLGPHLTFLFENRTTIRYQIQEMVWAERIVREADIQHEIDTYNALLGGPGELACCLLIEIEAEAERRRCLREWRALPGHIYLRCEQRPASTDHAATVIRAAFDPAQASEDQLSSVQYLRFCMGSLRPVGIGCDLPALAGPTPLEARLTEEQREALIRDLGHDQEPTDDPVATGHHGGSRHQRAAPRPGPRPRSR
jgi:hypothetical protein